MNSAIIAPARMSSREIAKATHKRHDNVLADIRKMLHELYGEGGVLKFQETYINEQNGQKYIQYRLDRDHTMTLITGYSAKLRMAVVRRLSVLENGADGSYRQGAAIEYSAMSDATKLSRDSQGKSTKSHHYMNEAKLVNGVLFGEYKGRDRNSMSPSELRLVMMIEGRNTFLLGQGKTYQQRKSELTQYAQSITAPKLGRAS